MAKKPSKSIKPKHRSPGHKLETEMVDSPFGLGFDKVARIIDTITAMHRRGQITDFQHSAAKRYQISYELTSGAIRSTLDDSILTAGCSSSRTPSPRALLAAGTLNEAASTLGMIDGRVVMMICGQGFSIEETARHFYGVGENGRPRDLDCRTVGKRLNDALSILARKWFGAEKRARPGTYIFAAADARPTEIGGDVVAHSAHAGHDHRGRFKVSMPGKTG